MQAWVTSRPTWCLQGQHHRAHTIFSKVNSSLAWRCPRLQVNGAVCMLLTSPNSSHHHPALPTLTPAVQGVGPQFCAPGPSSCAPPPGFQDPCCAQPPPWRHGTAPHFTLHPCPPPPQQQHAAGVPPGQAPYTLTCAPLPPLVLQQEPPYADMAAGLVYDATLGECVPAASDAVLRELQAAGHVLMPLGDAYRHKAAELQAAVNGPLMTRRTRLLQQVHGLAR